MLIKQRLSFIIVLLLFLILYAYQSLSLGISHAHTSELGQGELAQEKIVQRVLEYAKTEKENDPFIEIEPNLWIKQSNYEGVKIGGIVYYYSLFPHMSYDPVSRGEISVEEIEIIYIEDDQDFSIAIYTAK